MTDIGLSSIVGLLNTLHNKYRDLNASDELCKSLHKRMTDFADELGSMDPVLLEKEKALDQLEKLIRRVTKTIEKFAKHKFFVRRAMKVAEFQDAIKSYNEDLDHIIKLITVNQTAKLSTLLDWREKFEEDVQETLKQIIGMTDMQKKIQWDLKRIEMSMVRKTDFEGLLMLIKRLVPNDNQASEAHPSPELSLVSVYRNIITVAEKQFHNNQPIDMPPSWLISYDEVTEEEMIDNQGLTSIYMGTWKLARVAIKKFSVAVDEHPVHHKLFKVWHTLQHPNVAQLFGVGTVECAPFFVYEYASRQSLDRCWGQLTTKQIWEILHQVSIAIAYLHSNHIVHGDMSSSKILVTEGGNVKLFGFDASYMRIQNKSNEDKSKTFVDFRAPECAGLVDGLNHSPRFESDIYSFGLTIMEAITKDSPFCGLSSKQIMAMKKENKLPRPTNMSDEAWTLVKQMCDYDWRNRVSLVHVVSKLQDFAQPT